MTSQPSEPKISPYIRPITPVASHVFKGILVLAIAVITHESLIPAFEATNPTQFDKFMHFGAYGVLMILAALAIPTARLTPMAILLFCYGGAIEIAQSLMAQGRDGSFADQFANGAGLIVPILLWMWIKKPG